MKKILLSSGYETLVSDEDYIKYGSLKWSVGLFGGGKYPYAIRTDVNNKTIYLHRLIMDAPKCKVVDHKDGDTLNNQRINLRICTQGQNTLNRVAIQKNNTSGHKGVFYRKDRRRWIVVAWKNYKRKQFGSYVSKDEAIARYKTVIGDYFGEFASNH